MIVSLGPHGDRRYSLNEETRLLEMRFDVDGLFALFQKRCGPCGLLFYIQKETLKRAEAAHGLLRINLVGNPG